MLKLIVFLSLVGVMPSAAQVLKPGEWRNYTSMSNVSDVLVTPDSNVVWVATSGGVYRVPAAAVASANVQSYRNSDGIRDNNCSALGRTTSGDIVIGDSTGGINIYRQATGTFDVITDISSRQDFPRRQITRIIPHDSILLFATGFGLSIYNTHTTSFDETVTRFGNLTPQDTVFDVAQIGGTIYAVLSRAVASAPRNSPILSAPSAWKIVSAPAGVNLRSIASFAGKVVIGSAEGIFTLAADTLIPVSLPDSVSTVHFFVSAANDSLYILDARSGGRIVSTNDLATFHYFNIPRNGEQTVPSAFFVTPGQEQCIGFTTGGLTVANHTQVQTGFSPDGPLENYIVDLDFAQSLGKLYAVYGSAGMTSFDMQSSSWAAYRANGNTLPVMSYLSLFYDSVRSMVWLGTHGAGALGVKFSPSFSYTKFDASKGVPETFAGYVVTGRASLDNKNNILLPVWAQDGEGLAISTDAQTFKGVQLSPPGDPYRPFSVAVQDQNNVYFAATGSNQLPAPYGVIAVFPDQTTLPIAGGTGSTLGSESVNALIVDQDNGLWCGTNVGVQVLTLSTSFQTGQITPHARTLTFTDQQVVHAIAVDGIGNKWVGTEDGVFVAGPDGVDSLAHFTTANSPILSDVITSIAIDKTSGEAYIGTPKGISRVNSIFKEGNPDYSKISLYPNPIIQYGDDAVTMTIGGLMQGSTVKILTPAGRLVSTIDASKFGSTVQWNCRDDNNKLLPSGVYLVTAIAPNAPTSGQTKFVLVRK
ncbi:MAG TPA: hypothetical protein VEW28_08305 [Candidatus Kapabacteria bacterium]|nr:hypothetical protein [Candidatus Kapabacteria bacterium]